MSEIRDGAKNKIKDDVYFERAIKKNLNIAYQSYGSRMEFAFLHVFIVHGCAVAE